ncbi:dynamin family protein [Acidithiobacillus sulfuriphilus]|uniref:GTP-binding protein n=2 Tax=Acidithiobacillus sulfuriphilus TaxID=1867749 RepID=A0A3M8QUT1_9PROT|nr:dynamin family protein [Acidithiobacillus sulfuriphilus]RNF58754.1 GTP-binding protein [Acidithiobacillus sulfuriphilus]
MPSNQLALSPILRELQVLSHWRDQIAGRLHDLAALTTDLGLLPGGTVLRLETLAYEIGQDSLRVAFVGEFSRGKTELINALFFANVGGRLLPSSSGQTTMCPVEIRGAPQGNPGMQLLPIASRTLDVTIEKLKKAGSAWTRIPLGLESTSGRNAALAHLTETICVPIEEARRFGLCPPLNRTPKDRERTVCPSCGLGKVLIPRWRHALIYLPHPMLDAGLTVLDTPGLNAIGAEPELTFGMLADADAIIFVLGADTGVTQSDLAIWEQYLMRNPSQKQLVILNKVDTLWDELRDWSEVEAEIARQIDATAARLGVRREQVIPVSGQKGLVARIRQDADLLTRSGLSVLEEAIATILVPAQEASIRERCRAVVERTVMDQKAILRDQMQGIMAQMDSMRRLKEKTGEKVPKLVAQHQQILRSFEADRRAFEQKKTAFRAAVEEGLLAPLAPGTFDLIISNAKGEMLSAWTTAGIVERFKSFFADAIARFDAALEGAQQVATLVAEEYQPLQARYHLPQLGAIPYAIMPRRAELLTMAENYERFGMKLEIAVNTQGAVVRKAFLTVASRIRDFVLETRHEAESWVDEIMAVMNRQMEIFQARSEEELAALESISQAMGNIDTRILQLQRALEDRQADMRQVDARWTLLLPLLRQDHPASELPAHNP